MRTAVILFVLSPWTLAEGVAWREDYARAQEEARERRLPLYVEFSAQG